jgi:hypothetical protein
MASRELNATSVADPGCFVPDPGSGSLTFLSRIPDPGVEKAPDPGSRILLYIKIGMKNKTNFFLAFYSFRSKFFLVKKIKEQGFLRKSHQKTYPLDPGSGKNSSRIRIPDPGGKKAPDPGSRIPDPGSGSATLNAK